MKGREQAPHKRTSKKSVRIVSFSTIEAVRLLLGGGLNSSTLCDGDHELLLRVVDTRFYRKCDLPFASLRIVSLMIAERLAIEKVLSGRPDRCFRGWGSGCNESTESFGC